MAEIVNLGKIRKQKTRSKKDAKAKANRAAFGRTKGQKAREKADAARAAAELEGGRLDGKDD
jgi:hypothetical protein